jgi:hypothetical protein
LTETNTRPGRTGRPVRISGLERLEVDRFLTGHGSVSTAEEVRALRQHLAASLAEPEKIESLYPEWNLWGDTGHRNRAFLRRRAR